jgi:hypothetical protein
MAPRIGRYKLTKGDRELFALAETDPNAFTDWYFRGDNTGTWALPDAKDSRVQALYKQLYKVWETDGEPDVFQYEWRHGEHQCRVVWKPGSDEPAFHIHHGWLFQGWQLDFRLAPQKTKILIGGFGGGKTITGIVDVLIDAATLPGYRALCLAPYSEQAKEMWVKAKDLMEGTLYKDRFLISIRERPYPQIVIGNDYVGENIINFYSILDDVQKILTLEADCALIDQTERLTDIPDARRVISSRLRGSYRGRERKGQVVWIGNPYDNPDMWDMADQAEEEPEHIYFHRVSSYDNEALSEEQLERYKRDVGNDKASEDTFLKGFRPIGNGEHFPASSVEKCHSLLLDDLMKSHLLNETPGYRVIEAPRIGIVKWEMPPQPDNKYLVIADPGWGNPPKRNAAVIGVWDISYFPQQPAQLTAFSWVFGNNSPDPWMQQFYDYVQLYKAQGRAAYDATGLQSGYERWVEIFQRILSEGLKMGGANKYMHLNATKILMSRGLVNFPTIPGWISQMAKYQLPDDNLDTDIVSMLMMTCGWLERVFYYSIHENKTKRKQHSKHHVHEGRAVARGADRHGGHRR